MKFRKKPVIIEAFRYNLDPRPDWFMDKVTDNQIITYEKICEIKTLEGIMTGQEGDFIIKGVKGEIYPCKPYIFNVIYELADGEYCRDGKGGFIKVNTNNA